MSSHRSTHLAALGLAALAVAAPVAQARPDGAPATPVSPQVTHDYGDGGAARPAPPQVDARHAALLSRSTPARPTTGDDGTDWGDVAIVGGGGTAVLLALGASAGLAQRRRQTARRAGTLAASR